jgi:hypothetical protein
MEDFWMFGGSDVTVSDQERATGRSSTMARSVHLWGKRTWIAAALVTGVVAASAFVIGSSSTPPAAAQAAKPGPAATAAPASATAAAIATAKATATARATANASAASAKDLPVEKYPNPGPATSATATTDSGAAKAPASAYGCAAALAYLHAHAEPHFTVECPAAAYNAQGGPAQAMTCVSHPPQCPANTGVIAISDPCPTAYMNEAANSWIALGLRPGAMDPYGPSC